MSEMQRLMRRLRAENERAKWGDETGQHPGYYFCVGGCKRWFAGSLQQARERIEQAADQWLSEAGGWHYSIEYCHGLDVHGRPAWGNLDITDDIL